MYIVKKDPFMAKWLPAFLLLCNLLQPKQNHAQLSGAGLQLYLPLNGNANDFSGNNYNGFLTGTTPVTGADGTPNGALHFGLTDKILINNPAKLRGSLDELTILIKVKPDSIPNRLPVSNFAFFEWRYSLNYPLQSGDAQLSIYTYGTQSIFPPPLHDEYGIKTRNFKSVCGRELEYQQYKRDSAQVAGKWFSYAYVFNRGQVKQYYNCKQMLNYPANQSQFKPCETDSGKPMMLFLGNLQPFSAGNLSRSFSGSIDELRIYTRALNGDEIAAYSGIPCELEIDPYIGVQKKPCSNNVFTITDESRTYGIPVVNRKWRIIRDNFSLSGSGSFNYTCNRTGNYTVYLELTDINGYKFEKDTTFAVTTVEPFAHFIQTPQTSYQLCGSQKSVAVQLTGAASYQWQPCTDLSNCTGNNVTITPTDNRVYKISGIDNNGCTDSLLITVKPATDSNQVYIPTAFSPNGDGVNDYFSLQSQNLPELFSWNIYNRWGQKIFSGGPANTRWNGDYRNQPQPTGVYVWKLEYSGAKDCPVTKRNGTVALIR